MKNDVDRKTAHAIDLRWADLELTARQFEHYCEAWPHTDTLVRRVPRDRSRWDAPANVFAFGPGEFGPDDSAPAKDRRR